MDEAQHASILEQHIGTILQIMVVGLLGWSLITTQRLSQDIEVLKVKLETVSLTLNQGANDRYHGADAARDFVAVRQEIQFLERRIQTVESKVAK